MTVSSASPSDLDLWDRVVGALRGVRPDALCDFEERPGKIAEDAAMLDRLLAQDGDANVLRLWDNAECLVVTRRLAKRPQCEAARLRSQAAGWPVEVRASGGTTVAHRPGVLNISLFIVTGGSKGAIGDGFDLLCDLIIMAMASLGLVLEAGPVEGSYCDGSHNVRRRGRKLAGTAALARRRGERHGRMFHASLVVYGDVAQDVAAIRAFERWLGLEPRYRTSAHASVAMAAGDCRASGANAAGLPWGSSRTSPCSSG